MKNTSSWVAMMCGAGAIMGSANAADTPSASSTLEEVLVTASKRAAGSVQDAAYNISAVSGAALEKAGVDDLNDLTRRIPGLSTVDNGVNNKQIVIRGLAASAGTEQVSVYFDEIPTSGIGGTNVAQTDVRLYDVERVEVLRGPQGTLYGAGSQAGTLRYIMNKPRADRFEASADGSFGVRARDGGERMSMSAMVNVPVVADRFAVRAVGYYRDSDGFVDLPDLGTDGSDKEETSGGRVIAQFDIADQTTLSATAYYQDTQLDDSSRVLVDRDIRPGFVREPFEDRLRMYNATLEHDAGWGTFTATASKFDRDTFYAFDVSQFTPVPSRVNQPAQTEATSVEVRFASTFDSPVNFVAGGFYQDRDQTFNSFGAFVDTQTGNLPDDETRFFHSMNVANFTNKALFGELTYDVTDRLSLTAGARTFELERDRQTTLLIDFFGNPLGPEPKLDSNVKDQVYRLQASFKVSDDVLVYATYSEGFREGGENATFFQGDFPKSYAPDFVKNYEVGWKSELMDRQVVLNGALYYMQWQGIQVSQFDDTGAFVFTSNAGEADLQGIELESTLRPQALPGFSATLGLRLSDQKLTQDNPNAAAGDEFAGHDGDRIPASSRTQASMNVEQRFAVGRWNAYVRADATYTGRARTTFSAADPQAREWGDFVLTDLRVGVEQDSWNASLYLRNVFDERKPTGWVVQEVAGLPDLITTTMPREIGLQFGVRY